MIKHLIDWKDWEESEIRNLLDLAISIKNRRWDYTGFLHATSLAMIFQKTSTRTRVSLEVGMTELGGHAINLDWMSTNFTLSKVKYETKYLSRNVAVIAARLKDHNDILSMASAADVPVINACCNLYHPCQAFADMLTIAVDKGSLEGTKLTYIGVYNNVVNSLISICATLKVKLTLVCPIMDEKSVDKESRQKLLDCGLLTETLDAKRAVEDAEYVYTDTWIDMEFFSNEKYSSLKEERTKTMMPYQLNHELLKNSRAKVMHDMPIHPGYEITDELVNDETRSIIYDQAENRLDAQKAILITLARKDF